MRWPQPPQKANADATCLPQFGQGTFSTGGGENGDTCPGCMAGTAVAGTEVETPSGLTAPGLLAIGLCRTGTCMGTEPRPICTEGAEAGPALRGPDPGVAEDVARAGDCPGGGGVGPMGCDWLGTAPKGKFELPAMVGPTAENPTGSGGTAVLATLSEAGANSGGGVGGKTSAGGAGLAAAGAAACSLAPHPRQNLYRSWFSLPQREQVITRDPPRKPL